MNERRRNPFLNSSTGGRVLSALQLPLFLVRPPNGYGVLTTTGRRTGKSRRRCVRAVRLGDVAYVVAIKGEHVGWVRNIRAEPRVRLRVRGGTFDGVARDPADRAEWERGRDAYCAAPSPFEYAEFMMWRSERPRRPGIDDLHRTWFEQGTPLVIELAVQSSPDERPAASE